MMLLRILYIVYFPRFGSAILVKSTEKELTRFLPIGAKLALSVPAKIYLVKFFNLLGHRFIYKQELLKEVTKGDFDEEVPEQ
jgi:hypothetical protein